MKLCQINLGIHPGHGRAALCKLGVSAGWIRHSGIRSGVKFQWSYLLIVWLEVNYLTLLNLVKFWCDYDISLVWSSKSMLNFMFSYCSCGDFFLPEDALEWREHFLANWVGSFIFVDTWEGEDIAYNDMRVTEADKDRKITCGHPQSLL